VKSVVPLGSLPEFFASSMKIFGLDVEDVDSAFVINNPTLRLSLQTSMSLLKGKLGDTRSLFQREDWKNGPDSERKKRTLAHLGDYASVFHRKGWSDGSEPPVILVLQKIPTSFAMKVAQHGFGVLPMSAGMFGNGLYFTESFSHLNSVASGGDNDVFLTSLVLPGNPFPLTEMSPGSACRPGYQSHFATTEGTNAGDCAGELVIFDPTHALPLFMWTTRGAPQPHVQERASPLRKEWNFSPDETWNSQLPLLISSNFFFDALFLSLSSCGNPG